MRNLGFLTPALDRLRRVLVAELSPITYEVRLPDGGRHAGTASYSGPYTAGDRLVTMSGEQFVVVAVEEGRQRERLVVDSWVPAEMPQVAMFAVGSESISVSPRDGRRLVGVLVNMGASDATRAAWRIERAMRLHSGTTVRLLVGEDEAVLQALAGLRDHGGGGFGQSLERLESALHAKIASEG